MLTCWLDDTATPSPSRTAPNGTPDWPTVPPSSIASAIVANPAICIAKPEVTACLRRHPDEHRAHKDGGYYRAGCKTYVQNSQPALVPVQPVDEWCQCHIERGDGQEVDTEKQQ